MERKRDINFRDASITENARLCYPLYKRQNVQNPFNIKSSKKCHSSNLRLRRSFTTYRQVDKIAGDILLLKWVHSQTEQ
jgi:ribosomal protein L40E